MRLTGVIISQLTTRRGTWLKLRDRTHVYIPERIPHLLVGLSGTFTGRQCRSKTSRSFLYCTEYSLPEKLDTDRLLPRAEQTAKKLGFDSVLLRLRTFLLLLLYLILMGKNALIRKMSRWKRHRLLMCCENPYTLYLQGHLDFPSSDVLARALLTDESKRIYPLASFITAEAYRQGSESVPIDELVRRVNLYLTRPVDGKTLMAAVASGRGPVLLDGLHVFLRSVFFMKRACLRALRNQKPSEAPPGVSGELSSLLRWKYAAVTGRAGTGKTTLVRQLTGTGLDVIFTATTGKAAKRLHPSATTLHDLLGYGPRGFTVSRIKCGILVVDESSMLTWRLLHALIRRVEGKILFVGDPEQTAPVEAPAIFSEMLANMPPGSVLTLETLHRTQGARVEVQVVGKERAISAVTDLSARFEREGVSWQILTPLRRGAARLNLAVQRALRGGAGPEFRRGDRVMFLKNLRVDGELVAGNGDVGYVLDFRDGWYRVSFPHGVVNCRPEELVLAYAITIHKGMGSEYDCVVCYIPGGINPDFLTDDLIEVAGTRARVATYFICEDETDAERLRDYFSRRS